MPFPSSPREIYDSNPLDQVICQIRYPTILAISTTSPAQFQDAIRSAYPLYEEQKNPIVPPGIGLPKEIAELIAAAPVPLMPQLPVHHFLTESESRQISLSQEFIAVTEHQYRRWEDFQKEVKFAEQVLHSTYTPAFYNSVGLRYIDVLIRGDLGLSDTPWSELFNPAFIGMLGDCNLADDMEELQVESLLGIPDVEQGKVHLKHGLAKIESIEEQVYVIDADFHTNRRSESDDIFEALDKFSKCAGAIFRWAASEKLRSALGPTKI